MTMEQVIGAVVVAIGGRSEFELPKTVRMHTTDYLACGLPKRIDLTPTNAMVFIVDDSVGIGCVVIQ